MENDTHAATHAHEIEQVDAAGAAQPRPIVWSSAPSGLMAAAAVDSGALSTVRQRTDCINLCAYGA